MQYFPPLKTRESFSLKLARTPPWIISLHYSKTFGQANLFYERNKLLDKLGELGKIDYYEDTLGNVTVLFEGSSFVTTDHVNHIGIDRTLVSSVGYATPR